MLLLHPLTLLQLLQAQTHELDPPRCSTKSEADDRIGTHQNDSAVTPPTEFLSTAAIHVAIDQSADLDEDGTMERIRRERERLKQGDNRKYGKNEDRIWCCSCTGFTGNDPEGLCNICLLSRCSPKCGHLYNTSGRLLDEGGIVAGIIPSTGNTSE